MFLRFDDVIVNTDHIIRAHITKDDAGKIHLSIKCVSSGDQPTYITLEDQQAKEAWYELSTLCQNSLPRDRKG